MIGGSPSLARSRLMVVLTVVVNGSVAGVPHPFEQLLGRDGLALGGEQAFQHGELLGGERQPPPGPGGDRWAGSRVRSP